MRVDSSLLIATHNKGKLIEYRSMLSMIPLSLVSLDDFPVLQEVEETGLSFRENAILKAKGYARQTGLITLADDSGLEVDALGGRPGIFSARYAGNRASDTDRVKKLLTDLLMTKDPERRARFVCEIAVLDSRSGNVVTFDGRCEGHIAFEPRGTNGFGYDPIFIPDGYSRSFGRLPSFIKEKISHRGRALRAATPFLSELFESGA